MREEKADDKESSQSYQDFAAPLLGIAVLLVIILGLSAYWWNLSRVASCTTNHLKLSLGQPNDSDGTSYMNIILTDTGKGSCQLSGFATAFLTDGNNSDLGLGAAPASQTQPSSMILKNNKSAHIVLGFPDVANFKPGTCSSASQYLKVFPPGQSRYLKVAFTQYNCAGFSETPIVAGS